MGRPYGSCHEMGGRPWDQIDFEFVHLLWLCSLSISFEAAMSFALAALVLFRLRLILIGG